MRMRTILLTMLLGTFLYIDALAQTLPLVYTVENTGADCPKPPLPGYSELPNVPSFPDPFAWADGRGRMSFFSDWRYRRAEIKAQIENYEIGEKPIRPDSIQASYAGGVLTVNVTVNGQTLTLTSQVLLPAGTGPFPAVIGMNSPSGSIDSSIFVSRNVARIRFSHNQVTTYSNPQVTDPYYRLYPRLNVDNTGQYSAWAWGVSRIIDGLELVQKDLPIDLKHLAVTGCSYAGKMALFAGAFDERIALTIAQESGGGGATSWRYSQSEPAGTVEKIDNTDYNWFMNSMKQFAGDNVARLPEDHHELMAMVAPRALYATANPDYVWLSNPSSDVCSRGCQLVYNALGIPERFGFSIVGGHGHCSVPNSQIPEIGAFVDKFLLGQDGVNTNIATSPYSINLSQWIAWTNPTLSNGASFFGKASLIFPSHLQPGLDTTITFTWNKTKDAAKYFFQLATDPTFANVTRSDTSLIDTSKTITNLVKGKRYYWRIQARSSLGLGPWSDVWNFSTSINLPTKPQPLSVSPYPGRPGFFTFTWKRVNDADAYLLQAAEDQSFSTIYTSASVADTVKTLYGFSDDHKYYWRLLASNVGGSGPWSDVSSFIASVTDVKKNDELPTTYSLGQNYPNPFNPRTAISFQLSAFSFVTLRVIDMLGRDVTTLVNGARSAGRYTVQWDGKNERGESVSSGMYLYQIHAGAFVSTRKMIFTK